MPLIRRNHAALVAVMAVLVSAEMGCGGPSSGAAISARHLRASLARSGLNIAFIRARPSPGARNVVAGVATGSTGARVEFEFVLAAGRRGSTHQLGTLGIALPRDGLNENHTETARLPSGQRVAPVVRGVVGNVAYSLYFFVPSRAPRAATEDVVRRLDAALFDAFPADDAEAHPIRTTP